MINQKELSKITRFLAEKIFRNPDIMFAELPGVELDKAFIDEFDDNVSEVDLIDIIATLHNLLCEAVTGNRYNYMFHWANKIGSWCIDDIFDHDVFESEDKNE